MPTVPPKQHQRLRRLQFGRHQVTSPAIFASYRLGDYPTAGLKCIPWAMTNTSAILINAYDFTRRRFAKQLEEQSWNLSSALNSGERPILIDSGAYYFCKKTHMDVTQEDILDIQIKSGADVAVSLDHPFHPGAPDKKKRINRTVRNTGKMLDALESLDSDMPIMPVVHGHTSRAIGGCLERLQHCFESRGAAIERLGIGSVAPLAQNGNAQHAAEIIIEVRDRLPNTHLHCFSMGSALLMLLAFYCGADTVDSQSWIISAAFKYAQLPGHYVMRLARRDYATYYAFRQAKKSFAERLRVLCERDGFSVRNWGDGATLDLSSDSTCEQYVESLVDVKSNENVHNRACHNLWVYNFEVQQARKAIMQGTFDSFVSKRLKETRYQKAFLAAERLKNLKTSFATPHKDSDARYWAVTKELIMSHKRTASMEGAFLG